MNRNYAGTRAALNDRYAFPGGHELDGFPPTLMINAERDAMRASGDRFGAELLSAGADVEQHTLPGTRHAFLNRPRLDTFTRLLTSWPSGLCLVSGGDAGTRRRLLPGSRDRKAPIP